MTACGSTNPVENHLQQYLNKFCKGNPMLRQRTQTTTINNLPTLSALQFLSNEDLYFFLQLHGI